MTPLLTAAKFGIGWIAPELVRGLRGVVAPSTLKTTTLEDDTPKFSATGGRTYVTGFLLAASSLATLLGFEVPNFSSDNALWSLFEGLGLVFLRSGVSSGLPHGELIATIGRKLLSDPEIRQALTPDK